jgi:hypothetical protein
MDTHEGIGIGKDWKFNSIEKLPRTSLHKVTLQRKTNLKSLPSRIIHPSIV